MTLSICPSIHQKLFQTENSISDVFQDLLPFHTYSVKSNLLGKEMWFYSEAEFPNRLIDVAVIALYVWENWKPFSHYFMSICILHYCLENYELEHKSSRCIGLSTFLWPPAIDIYKINKAFASSLLKEKWITLPITKVLCQLGLPGN